MSRVRLLGLGAEAMDDPAHLELRAAEEIVVFFADQQPGRGQQFLVALGTQLRYQFLGLTFEVRGERLLERQDRLLGRGR